MSALYVISGVILGVVSTSNFTPGQMVAGFILSGFIGGVAAICEYNDQ
jgi:hypothetical protein